MGMKLIINKEVKEATISPEIYGHFAEHLGRGIYEGVYVGENSDIPNVNGMRCDVVNALKEINVPVLRWPGGCYADDYHWMDGIGDKSKRKRMVNNIWGGSVEDNSFGTHEYMELCRQLGCKTYVNGNVSTGTVREMEEWVEYMTFVGESPMANLRAENGHPEPFPVDYFGVGNETWGYDGFMKPEYYAGMYRQYANYIRDYDPSKPIQKICVGPNTDDYEWTDKVLNDCIIKNTPRTARDFMKGFSLHYYAGIEDWNNKFEATKMNEREWYSVMNSTAFMDEIVTKHGKIMDRYDENKEIGLMVDEWGTWYKVEEGTNPGFLYQQNTIRDALVAAITLNIFNKHADRVKMACIAQMINVLQAMALTEGEKMILTPTYFVFHMFKHHQGAALVQSNLVGNTKVGVEESRMTDKVWESVSVSDDGFMNITLANASLTDDEEIEIVADGYAAKEVTGVILTGAMNAHNTFDNPEVVKEQKFEGFEIKGDTVKVKLPARSVVLLRVKQ